MATNGKASTAKAAETDLIHDLSEQVAMLKSDISTLTQAMGTYTKDKGAEAVKAAQSTAEDVAEAGAEALLETQKQAEDFVRTQPATALGIAAGVGFLIGLFATRR